MDLIRKILFEIESYSNGPGSKRIVIDGYSEDEIDYHLSLMNDAGFFEAAISKRSGQKFPLIIPTRLTWVGHDFLEASRDENRWNQAKEIVRTMGSGVTFEVFKSILVQIMMSQIPKFP
jgi:hypothetical protein